MKQKSLATRISIGGIIVIALVIALLLVAKGPSSKTVVGIIEPLQHVAVTDITNGVRAGLGEYADKVDILVENANRDNSQLAQIIANYRDQDVSVYVPIFTNTAQTVKASIADRPVVFAAVTDPMSAHLLNDPQRPEGNITGVSDLWPIGANLDLIRSILPDKDTIGIVFDPGDPSSAATMPLLQDECVLVHPKSDNRPEE